jgi:nitroreductase
MKFLRSFKSALKQFVKNKLPNYLYKSSWLSSLYYFLFDSAFRREHQAVLAGKVKHLKETEVTKENYFLMVRNTHRLEKGLLMIPRRPVFAADYIEETITCFEAIWKLHDKGTANPQMKWFHDVIAEYFAHVGSNDPRIKLLGDRFNNIISAGDGYILEASINKSIPYRRLEDNRSTISYDEFFKLTKQRRSVRWFLDKRVPHELIDKAVLAANQSPSACNRQPFEFRIIDDPEFVKRAIKLPMGTTGYGHSVPVMIVIVGNLDAYFDERDRHVIYIDASLASMSLMLALETLGLSSCAINWPDIEDREQKMAKFLSLEAHQRPIMCLGLGYPDPDGSVAFSEKRTLNQIRKYNLN